MKSGDMIRVVGREVPVYPDVPGWDGPDARRGPVGYVDDSVMGVLIEESRRSVIVPFHKVLVPELGLVWINQNWIRPI